MQQSLDDVCEFINGGAWSDSEYVESGIHVVKVTNMVNGTIVPRDDNYLPVSKYDTYKKHELKCYDIVVATVGSHPTQPGSVVGRTSLIPEEYAGSFLNQNAVCLRVKRDDLVDQRFLYYLSKTILFKHHIESRARGSANQVRMALGELKNFTFDYPDVYGQKKIAAILSAYDDLIENNKRRIALLEKMAEEMYREWFVRMRFPGYEKVRFVKGVLEGWEVAELGELAEINSSSIGRSNRPDTINYVDIGSVTTNQITDVHNISYEDAPGRAKRIVKHGDIIWSSVRPGNRAYCLIYEPPEDMVVSTGFAVISHKDHIPYTFLNFAVTTDSFVEQMTMVARGAAYPATSFDDFEKAKLLVPDEKLLKAFDNICEVMFKEKYLLSEENIKLSVLRDLLLPRLISGKLSVEDLDIQFPPSMVEEPEGETSEQLALALETA